MIFLYGNKVPFVDISQLFMRLFRFISNDLPLFMVQLWSFLNTKVAFTNFTPLGLISIGGLLLIIGIAILKIFSPL